MDGRDISQQQQNRNEVHTCNSIFIVFNLYTYNRFVKFDDPIWLWLRMFSLGCNTV